MNVAPAVPAVSIRYSPVNQAYFVLWHDQVLRVFPARSGALADRDRARGQARAYMSSLGTGLHHARTHENPLSEGGKTGLVAGLAILVVGGAAVAVYFATRPAQAAQGPTPPPGPPGPPGPPVPVPATNYSFVAGRSYRVTLMAPVGTPLPNPTALLADIASGQDPTGLAKNFQNITFSQPLANELIGTGDCTVSFTMPNSAMPVGWSATVDDLGPSASGSPPPPTTSMTWKRVTSIPSGAQTRISLPVSALSGMLPHNTVNDFATWSQFATSLFANIATGLVVYPPTGSPARPADWPSDDTATATEYSAAFTYTAPIALPAGQFTAWVLS